ncbi:MAG: SDR family oxidoreductase [Rhodospirillales bacterium]|jgi:meso-butanediol dehydrogenase/(S,S)-butanediol dehydrogenase/diacetyl reductase|nr:SDR family oxidoreductase [Rhodospirillales bacterium]MDP6804173.1 SDR family oxidoreductase [Rhodospirillales bacterium]
MDFSGKAVLVTGGTSGIGAATAKAFAGAGAAVVITGRNSGRAADVIASAADASGEITFLEADLREPGIAENVVADSLERLGRLDVLVNNAGVLHRFGTLETTPEQWHETMAVNLNAVFFLSRAAAQQMKEQGEGTIVNVSSELGRFADVGTVSYCVTKAAIVQLTRALALDLAGFGIRVNAVAPGETHTAMLESAVRKRGYTIDQGLARFAGRVPLGRVANPDEIADVILFLASDDASYITGATLSADGGTSAAGPGGAAEDPKEEA